MTAVENACIGAEVAAAEVSEPTPGANEFLAACHQREKPVVIVSNNAAEAVHTYLKRFRLHGLIRGVVGRQPHRPDLMKPHPSLVAAALDVLSQPSSACVLIGDSVSDIAAAKTGGIPPIGLAKNEVRRIQLEAAGPASVVDSVWELMEPMTS